MPNRNARFGGCVIVAILIFAAVVAFAVGGFSWFADRWQPAPAPGEQRCVATAGDNTTALTLEQAHYASIIAGVSVTNFFLGLRAFAAMPVVAFAWAFDRGVRRIPRSVLVGALAVMVVVVFPLVRLTRETRGTRETRSLLLWLSLAGVLVFTVFLDEDQQKRLKEIAYEIFGEAKDMYADMKGEETFQS